MSYRILERTVASVADKRLGLDNAEARRELLIASDWTKIRLGYRISTDGVASLSSSPRLWLGLLRNTANPVSDETTGGVNCHFVGIRSDASSWTLNPGPPKFYGGTQFKITKKESLAIIPDTVNIASPVISADPTVWAVGLFLEIDKNDGSLWKFQVAYQTTSPLTHLTHEKFLDFMDISDLGNAPTIQSGYAVSSILNKTVDEASFGTLTTITAFNDELVTEMEYSDVAWRKVS